MQPGRRWFLKAAVSAAALIPARAFSRRIWSVEGADSASLRLLFLTDIHARPEKPISDALAIASEAINRQRADLVLCGGDLIEGGLEMSRRQSTAPWDVYMAMHRSIEGDIHCCLGNHDLVGVAPSDKSPAEPDPRSEFRRRTGLERTFYAFNAAGYHVIVLDSIELINGPGSYRGGVSDEQLEWLTEDLSAVPRDQPIILMLHMPLVTNVVALTRGASVAAPHNRVTVNNRAVLAKFRDRNLILVLQGHSHVAEIIHWPRTTFLSGGAICANWWRGAYLGVEEGFNLLTLHPDRIEWNYIDYGWNPE